VSAQDEHAWGVRAEPESRLPASLATIVAVALYVALPDRLTVGPVWLVPALEIVLLVALLIFSPQRLRGEPPWRRAMAIALIAIINAANIASLVLLVRALVVSSSKATGLQLIGNAAEIWLTNIIVFALWYWELDRGGPARRSHAKHPEPDFLFPQMVTAASAKPDWAPRFIDYLFVSFTNATAFSPTDTMPLTPAAKVLFMAQALTSLLTVALVAARAVNILS